MSFDIIAVRSYGTGSLGDVENPQGQINSYARVMARNNKSITVDLPNASIGAVDFVAGTEILLHISGLRSSSGAVTNLGKYKFVKIMNVNGNTLILNDAPLLLNVNNYYYQAVTVPHYKKLTLSATVEPPTFDEAKGYGGIICFKCSNRLVMSGKINLVDKGLLTESYRPLLNQESNGTLDVDTYAGYENYETVNHFVLNRGDGAAMIIAKRVDFDDTARIGNPNMKGVQRCRGAEDSYNRTTEMTNIGGSTILIAAETINDFDPAIISKYRSKTLETGKGLCRAYIATESRLPFDEGLYAYDIINTPERLGKQTLINGFGSGALGNSTKPQDQQNNYAKVSKISDDGKTFTLTNITGDGIATFERNALVMIHASFKSSAYAHVGRFFVANIVGITNTTAGKLKSITLDHSISELDLNNFDLDHYDFQAIAIPQYKNFTLADINDKTPVYSGTGGIFAIAVSNACNLSDAFINVVASGGSKYNLAYVSNANMKNRLPIGEGHGSIFILAKTLKVNTSTRLGDVSSGNAFGGGIGVKTANYTARTRTGGFMGKRPNFNFYSLPNKNSGYGGSAAKGGTQANGHTGGYCGNASDVSKGKYWYNTRSRSLTSAVTASGDSRVSGLQGASLFIVAQTIDGLSLDCLATGGQYGSTQSKKTTTDAFYGSNGGCGYGGGGNGFRSERSGNIINFGAEGGVHGGGAGASATDILGNDYWSGGGGSSGFCCIYCNEATNQSTENMLFN